MLLYIHVPFCRERCSYCAFYSVPLHQQPKAEDDGFSQEKRLVRSALGSPLPSSPSDLASRFADNVCLEMAKRREDLEPTCLTSIFFGGGTPSLLSPADVRQIITEAAKLFNFSDSIEVTLEGNPESLNQRDHFTGLREAGVNRLSFGVQAFDDAALRLLGRLHTAEEAAEAVRRARRCGFSNVGIDLIWGIPLCWDAPSSSAQQDRAAPQRTMLDRWLHTLHRAVDLNPDHISAYGLTLEQETPLHRMHERGELVMPDEDTASSMFLEGSAFLESHGYVHYEISNFAKPGRECLHNTGYWKGEEYLGLGPSATSTIRELRWTTPMNVYAWDKQIITTGAAARDIEHIGPANRLKEKVMLSLRTNTGLDLRHLAQALGHPLCPEQIHLVEELQSSGLATFNGTSLILTKKGMLVSDEIISRFFAFSLDPSLF